jgi:hypothetical protein
VTAWKRRTRFSPVSVPLGPGVELLHEGAERYLKAYLVHCGWQLVKTHDLSLLVAQACLFDPQFANFAEPARILQNSSGSSTTRAAISTKSDKTIPTCANPSDSWSHISNRPLHPPPRLLDGRWGAVIRNACALCDNRQHLFYSSTSTCFFHTSPRWGKVSAPCPPHPAYY